MFEDFPDCSSVMQPEFFRESISLTHALRRFLPLARRRLITLRPPGVATRESLHSGPWPDPNPLVDSGSWSLHSDPWPDLNPLKDSGVLCTQVRPRQG